MDGVCRIGKEMTRAKAWFDKLTTLSKVEGQSTPSSEKGENIFSLDSEQFLTQVGAYLFPARSVL
jgi:hypothetical protein